MIWFDNNQGKKNLIIILVVVFMIFIFWLWLRFSPWQTPATSVVQNTNQTQATSTSPWDELKNTWQQAGDQIAKWQTAWQRQEKQQELLDATKKYIADMASSTATSTATSTPKN